MNFQIDVNYLRSDLETFVKSFDNIFVNQINTDINGQQNGDQLWIDHWINNRFYTNREPNPQINPQNKSIKCRVKINDFKSELKSILNTFSEFSEKVNNLSENIDSFCQQNWISLISCLNEQKVILSEKLSLIETKLPLIKSKINENKRKRSKKCKKNIKHINLMNESLKNKNQLINEWFNCNQNNSLEETDKTQNDSKNNTNIELIEIKNKIKVIKSRLKKVNKLQKLRNQLIIRAQRRKQVIDTKSEDKFHRKTNKTKNNLNHKLDVLREEEKQINSLIRSESKKELDDKTDNYFSESQHRITDSLFGSQAFPEQNSEESIKNRQFFERSHQNIQNMIEVRNSWDRYLDMNYGTPIPLNYIIPNKWPNNEWKQYLDN